MAKGKLIIISGPSGTGKTTLAHQLVQCIPQIEMSISYTTRQIRPSEVNGEDYYFIEHQQFLEMITNEELLEYSMVYGNYYGVSSRDIIKKMSNGINIILVIDAQGAMKIKRQYTDSILIYVLPPSLEGLELRLRKRCQDSDSVIQKRLSAAKSDILAVTEYDHVIMNDDLQDAVKELKLLVRMSTTSIDEPYVRKLVTSSFPLVRSCEVMNQINRNFSIDTAKKISLSLT